MNAKTRRWLARASFALMFGAVALLLGVAGWRSLALVAFAAIGGCAVVAGGYWFLAHRGVLRWIALALVIAAPVLILVTFALASLLWVAIVAVALMVAAAGTARAALGTGGQDAAMPARPAARPRRPFLIMNPRSGGGKVTKFGLPGTPIGATGGLADSPCCQHAPTTVLNRPSRPATSAVATPAGYPWPGGSDRRPRTETARRLLAS